MEFIATIIFNGISILVEFMAAPLELLFDLLTGIFYFIFQLFAILIYIVQLFHALFQMFMSFAAALLNTLLGFTNFSTYGTIEAHSHIREGMNFFYERLEMYGVMTTIPNVINAFVWFIFAINMIGLIGSKGQIKGTFGKTGFGRTGWRSSFEKPKKTKGGLN